MSFPEDLAEKARKSLVKLGVTLRCGAMVKDVNRNGLTIEVNKHLDHIDAKTVIWAGGITVSRWEKFWQAAPRPKVPGEEQSR